jgi:two-component system chemotaxis response regulator CheB
VTQEDIQSDLPAPLPLAQLERTPHEASIVVLGAGTGGPPTIQEILAPLEGPLPPIVVIQELAPEYQRGFVAWLDDATELRVRLATSGDELTPGHVYVVPHGDQPLLLPSWRLELSAPSSVSALPRLDRFLQSVAEQAGSGAVGVVLIGMGCDGAKGLLSLRARGGVTLAQTEATSVVASMPRAAVDSGGARATMSPSEIVSLLSALTWRRPNADVPSLEARTAC